MTFEAQSSGNDFKLPKMVAVVSGHGFDERLECYRAPLQPISLAEPGNY